MQQEAKQKKLQDCDYFTDEQKLEILRRCNQAKEQMQAIRSRIQDDFFWRYFKEVKFTKDKWKWFLIAKVESHLPPEVNRNLMETLNFSISIKDGEMSCIWMGTTPEAEEHYIIMCNDPKYGIKPKTKEE